MQRSTIWLTYLLTFHRLIVAQNGKKELPLKRATLPYWTGYKEKAEVYNGRWLNNYA